MDVFNVTVNEREEREDILRRVKEYCDKYHTKPEYKEGDRIPYASRVYDSDEMCNLVDSSLEFWLTSGRYTDEFEKRFAEYLGVRSCSLVNSGSSANLLAFMALTSPLLGDRAVKRGDETVANDSYFNQLTLEVKGTYHRIMCDMYDVYSTKDSTDYKYLREIYLFKKQAEPSEKQPQQIQQPQQTKPQETK